MSEGLDVVVRNARELGVVATAVLGAVTALLVVVAIALVGANRRLHRELVDAERELVDRRTGLLPRGALRVRLGAELAWAAASRTPLAVLVLHVRGSRFTHAARVLRRAMREEEGAFLLDRQHVVVELWDADPAVARGATRRLGATLARCGHPVVDAGLACAPQDGSDVETLVAAARRNLRPIDDPAPAALRSRGRASHLLVRTAQAVGVLAAAIVLLVTTLRLLPAAIEPALIGAATRTDEQLVVALITLIGIPVGAALLLVGTWNLPTRWLPGSRPHASAGWRTALLVTLLLAAPLAWAIHAPTTPEVISDAFGATLAQLALIVLVALHGRQLVHLPLSLLLALALVGGFGAWAGVELTAVPELQLAGQLLLVTSIAALVVRHVERASWLLALALVSAVASIVATVRDLSLLEWLLGADLADDVRLPGLTHLVWPSIEGGAPVAVTLTAVLLLAIALTWGHDWRVDLRWMGGTMLLAVWSWAVAVELLAVTMPLTPWLGGGIVLLLLGRSLLLRGHVAAALPTAAERE